MATNSLGTVDMNIISQSFMEALSLDTAPLNYFTTDFRSEVAVKGAGVVTRVPTALSAQSKDVSGSYSSSDVTLTDITVTLANHSYVQFALNEVTMAKSMINIEKNFIAPASLALAQDIEDKIFALVKNANYSNSVVASAGAFDYAKLVDLEASVDALGYGKEKALILPSSYIATLRKDSAVRDSLNTTVNETTVNGSIGRLGGFDIVKNNRVPANGENLKGFAVDRRGIVVAARVLPLAEAAGVSMSVSSLPNGLSVRQTRYFDPTKGDWIFRFDVIHGCAVGIGNAVYRIKSA